MGEHYQSYFSTPLSFLLPNTPTLLVEAEYNPKRALFPQSSIISKCRFPLLRENLHDEVKKNNEKGVSIEVLGTAHLPAALRERLIGLGGGSFITETGQNFCSSGGGLDWWKVKKRSVTSKNQKKRFDLKRVVLAGFS